MTTKQATDPDGAARHRPSVPRGRWPGPRAWAIVGVAAGGAGLALNWGWLTAIGVAPILIGVLPCAAMCALGLCMRGGGGGGGSCAKESAGNENGPASSSRTAKR